MKKIQLFICENLYPEYQAVLETAGFEDVVLHTLPSLCEHKGRKEAVKEMLSQAGDQPAMLIGSKGCDLLKYAPQHHAFQTISTATCFSYLTSDDFLQYLIKQGSYIISTGWLKNWQAHIARMGFDQRTARRFFAESCKQLTFLDANIEDNAKWQLEELASYVGLPSLTIPIDLEMIRLMLKNAVAEQRLHDHEKSSAAALNELRDQCAEYAAVFDMLGKISTYTIKRDVIGKIKELFLMVFGAQQFKFWSDDEASLRTGLPGLQIENEEVFLLLKDENRFLIKIEWDNLLYGIIDVGGFLFPQYIEKYLNLALPVAKFCGLVLHNNEQYEKILISEKELKYISFHDAPTGLYNRTYINHKLKEQAADRNAIVFMFDIDRLKFVNDQYGHAEGDKLICSFARIAVRSFRETDVVARIGGDEFTAIIYDADEATALQMKQRIEELITANNTLIEKSHLKLSVSAGYAQVEKPDDTIEDLMKRADERMYEDKMQRRKARVV